MNVRLDCREVRGSLSLYSGGDLMGARLTAVEHHLQGCGACRAEAAASRQARQALVAGLAIVPTREIDLWPRLRASLAEEGLLRDTPRRAIARPADATSDLALPSRRRHWLSVGTLAAAALLAGLWLSRSTSTPLVPAGRNARVLAPDPALVDATVPRAEAPAVTPVKASGGLRRVAAGEASWSKMADIYGIEKAPMEHLSPWSANVGSPVSLQRVGRPLR